LRLFPHPGAIFAQELVKGLAEVSYTGHALAKMIYLIPINGCNPLTSEGSRHWVMVFDLRGSAWSPEPSML